MNARTSTKPLQSTLALALALAAGGCRSKIEVHSEHGARDENGGVPKPDQVAVRGTKVVFQSRDTVTIDINPDLLRGAPRFSVINVGPDGASAANPTAVIQGAVPSLGLSDDRTFSLDSTDDTKMTISFYPADTTFKDKFIYGANTLRVLALDPSNPRYSTVEFTLFDFDLFETASLGFSSNVQLAVGAPADDYQFQGWLNTIGPAQAYAADGTTLSTGFFDIINPQ